MNRADVYRLIDGERRYQDALWSRPQHNHSVTEFLVYMRDYVDEGLHLVSRHDDSVISDKVKGIVRKVAALAVACMEDHGAPSRISTRPRDVLGTL